MAVEKMPDGRWRVRYRKGYNPDDPERTKEYFGRGPEAEREAIRRDAELKLASKVKRLSPLFGEVANEYIKAHVAIHPETSLKNLVWKMRGVIFPRIGQIEAVKIDHKALTKYVNGRVGDGVKRTTIHRELSDIRAILNWAEREKYIVESPFKGFRMPRRDDSFVMPTTDEEFDKIMQHAAPHVIRAMLIAYYTGLRPGVTELFSLKWDSVDFESRTISIKSSDKGGIPRREVPIHHALFSKLREWFAEDAKIGADSIVHYKGAEIRTSMKSAWRAAVRRAGITKKIRPYSIRHKTISNLAEQGHDIKTVAEIVGHTDPATTMRVYQQTTSRMKRNAIDSLGAPPESAPSEEKP